MVFAKPKSRGGAAPVCDQRVFGTPAADDAILRMQAHHGHLTLHHTGGSVGTVLTVSTVTGSTARADELRARHPRALAEAMEGFGVAEAAGAHGVPALEIRAVSNPVGPRDRAAWRIGDALAALTGAFGKLEPLLESWNPHERTH